LKLLVGFVHLLDRDHLDGGGDAARTTTWDRRTIGSSSRSSPCSSTVSGSRTCTGLERGRGLGLERRRS
jgi:hypothetical protein